METIEAENTRKIPLANPNPDVTYKDDVRGKEYVFPPLKRFMVDERLALTLLEQARANKSNRDAQASAEVNQYRMLLNRGKQYAEAFGRQYVDIGPDGQLSPKTKPYKFLPLVRLDEDEGLKTYNAGVKYAVDNGIALPSGAGSPGAVEVSIGGAEGKTMVIQGPSNSWSLRQLAEYIKENGGTSSLSEPHGRLYYKARKLHEAKIALLASLGVKVSDPEYAKEPPPEDVPEGASEEQTQAQG